MRALVTGAMGAVGWYLCRHLEEQGDQVHAIARPSCDLNYRSEVCDALEQAQPEVIYHLASTAIGARSWDWPSEVVGNNVRGTLNLLEAVRALNIKPVVVLASSAEVYGAPVSSLVGEEHPLAPGNPYGVSKVAQEMLVRSYGEKYGIPFVILRAFGDINPRGRGRALTSFAFQIAEIEAGKREVLEHGALRPVRAFCDVRDMVRAYRLAVGHPGETFNIGGAEPASVWNCLDHLIGLARCVVGSRFNEALARAGEPVRVVPDCRPIERAAGWRPEIPLASSLEWLLDEARRAVSHGEND